MLLATTTDAAGAAGVPDFAWSTFAPELLLSGVVMVLLLLLVANRFRTAVAALCAAAVVVVGVLLAVPVNGWEGDAFLGGVVIAFGIAVIALTIGLGGVPRLIGPWIAGAGTLAALLLTGWQIAGVLLDDAGAAAPVLTAGGSVAFDGIAVLTRVTVLVSTLLVLLFSHGYLRERGIARGEFEPLVLLSAVGMMLLGAANDAITLFVALEILSISLYVLAGLARRDRRSQEAAIKYFVMGAVASAILLYGLALAYVATGTLDLPTMALRLSLTGTDIAVAGLALALVTVGIGFKIAMAPFQLWTPDVYQGAPTNVTAFMAAGTKAAGFAIVLRLYLLAFAPLDDLWLPVITVLAAITMLYGALGAVVQVDLKRILAYSSLAHAGYALIGVVAGGDQGVSATTWYLLTYAVSTLAAFGVVIAAERKRRGEVTLSTVRGLGRTQPVLAWALTIALLSLAGIPPTAGFAGKLEVFRAGVASGFEWLVVIGVLSSVIAAFFYLRIIGAMFLEEPETDEAPVVPDDLNIGISLAAAAVVFLGIQPQLLLDIANRTAQFAQ